MSKPTPQLTPVLVVFIRGPPGALAVRGTVAELWRNGRRGAAELSLRHPTPKPSPPRPSAGPKGRRQAAAIKFTQVHREIRKGESHGRDRGQRTPLGGRPAPCGEGRQQVPPSPPQGLRDPAGPDPKHATPESDRRKGSIDIHAGEKERYIHARRGNNNMIGAQGYARSACAQYSRIDVAFYLIEKLIFRLPGIASPPNPPMSACGQSGGARA